ncbi:MAG: 23S rRNA (adenine(2503)-C(2))-methyltransferase RlmN [Pseudomonadota bacterium]
MSAALPTATDTGTPVITGRTNLLGLDEAGMVAFVESLGEKRFRARQLLKWLYHQDIRQFDDMTDLSKAFRAALREHAEVRLPEVEHAHVSRDGTCKWLFKVDSANAVETVFIPSEDRGTLCVSSQVGCALDCSFCATARQGFNRNLTTAEIVAQVYLASELLRSDAYRAVGFRRITNIVMMGMGEPLANFRQLVPALKLMLDDNAWGLSKRRVTVSTSGIVPAIDRLREAVDCSLAVSLHAPDDALRDELVPINRKYPIKDLMAACRRYVERDHKTHIMFEYVMLAGVNDSPEHARALAKLVKSVPCKVNMIPFNPFPGSGYSVSSEAAINRFWDVLNRQRVRAIKRRTRGDDIDAACGQLAGDVTDKSRRAAKFAEPRFGESRP